MNAPGRILALDLGKKRIGVAVSDELGLTAQGLETMERQGRRTDIEMLRRVAVQYGVTKIVLGDPIHMSGGASEQSGYNREFGAELQRKTNLPVIFRDERLTSWEAAETIRGAGVAHSDRRAALDRLSAVILLRNYLDEGRPPALLPDTQEGDWE